MANKYKKLFLSLLLDGVGMFSYAILGLAEGIDIVWAPLSAYIMTKLYKGTTGKVAGFISFIEEALPGVFDFIPTFTLTWIYQYVIKKEQDDHTEDGEIIDIS